jgi:hypothetical protein
MAVGARTSVPTKLLAWGGIEGCSPSRYWRLAVWFLSETGVWDDGGNRDEAKKTKAGDGRVSEFVHGGYPFRQDKGKGEAYIRLILELILLCSWSSL